MGPLLVSFISSRDSLLLVSEDEDYEEKYPPDEPFKGMSPTARVWKVFVDEFTKFDMEMIAKWRDALDTTLLFVCPHFYPVIIPA